MYLYVLLYETILFEPTIYLLHQYIFCRGVLQNTTRKAIEIRGPTFILCIKFLNQLSSQFICIKILYHNLITGKSPNCATSEFGLVC